MFLPTKQPLWLCTYFFITLLLLSRLCLKFSMFGCNCSINYIAELWRFGGFVVVASMNKEKNIPKDDKSLLGKFVVLLRESRMSFVLSVN